MKITEKMRIKTALEMIEDISSDAQSTCPKKTWQTSHDAVCEIYKLVHSLRSIGCRKNHPAWLEKIDAGVMASKNHDY